MTFEEEVNTKEIESNGTRLFLLAGHRLSSAYCNNVVRLLAWTEGFQSLLEKVLLAVLAALPRVSWAEEKIPLPESCAESALLRPVSLSF